MATRKRDTKDIKLRASHERPESAPKSRKRPGPGPGKLKLKPAAKKRLLPQPAPQRSPEPPRDMPAPMRKARIENVPTESVASDSARKLAIEIAAAALEKKAVGIEILDVAGRTDYADFLVLMSGRSDRQVAALSEGIDEAMRTHGRHALNIEGRQGATWILMDFGDVVVHVFQEEVRSMYDLEGLWQDARRLPVSLE